MHLLLIHQSFPGQFRDLAPAWLARGHRVTAIGSTREIPASADWQGLRYLRYSFDHEPSALERGKVVARFCLQLLEEGNAPDLVLCHSAWGEALLLRRVLATTPWISYPELWGRPQVLGFGFDNHLDDYAPTPDTFSPGNLLAELAILQSDAAVVASRSQRDGFPAALRHRLTLLSEGVNLERLPPPPEEPLSLPGLPFPLEPGQPLVTFISREMEPLRGLRQLLLAWPHISAAVPEARLLLVGGDGGGYGMEPPHGDDHLSDGLAALPDAVDRSRIHHLGYLPHLRMLQLLHCSACHVALSYPYTLSWSVLEAMACGVAMVSNPGSPIAGEFLEQPDPPLMLVPFNDVSALSNAVTGLLQNRSAQADLGRRAHAWITENQNLARALDQYDLLFERLRQRAMT